MKAKEKAMSWIASTNLDAEAKNNIQHLLDTDPEGLSEAFYKDLEFGTGGLRGIMGIGSNRLNEYTIGRATQGFANYLKKTNSGQVKVAIAHDSRNYSRFFAEKTAHVFSANDIEVYLFDDLRPTPELSFAIRHLACQGGVVITASHNPKEYNGYKAYWSDGAQLIAPHDKNVITEVNQINNIDEVTFEPNPNLIYPIGEKLDRAYCNMIKGLSLSPESIQNQHDLKIVFSSIHGTGITLIPRVLEEIGFSDVHIVQEQSSPDGNFPTVIYPNPEEEETMSFALKKAEDIDADLVMATDPDADRVGIAVINTRGEYQLLNGNQTGVLLIYYLLKRHSENGFKGNEYVVKTIVTTELIRNIAESFNIPCYDTLTGSKFIADVIGKLETEQTFIGGGEESYGYLIGDQVRDKDAVASCVMIAEMVAWTKDQGKSLFELLIYINKEFGLYEESLKSITRTGMKGSEEIQAMMKKFREQPPNTLAGSPITHIIDYQTGKSHNLEKKSVKDTGLPVSNVLQFISGDGSKISVRPSGTEPKIKFYFSVKSDFTSKDYYQELEILKEKTHNLLIDLGL